MAEQVQIRAYYKYTLYDGEGYRICRMEYETAPTDGQRKDFVARGPGIPEACDVVFILDGEWQVKPYRGKPSRTFVIKAFETEKPTSKDGVISYLTSLKAGVGKSMALKLYNMYQEGIWDVLEHKPDLIEAAGIMKPKAFKRLRRRLEETQAQKQIMQTFKGGNAISMRKANRLCKVFGSEAVNVLRDHPYKVCRVPGFSFEQIDSIALEARRDGQKMDPASFERIEAAAAAVLDKAAHEGDVCLPRQVLIEQMCRLLNKGPGKSARITPERCDTAVSLAISDKLLANTAGFVYTMERYMEEKRICVEINRLMQAGEGRADRKAVYDIIAKYEAETGMQYADSQKEAVYTSVSNAVSIITGGPGTGKTTVTKLLLHVFRELDPDGFRPVLLSPTGKAARRMAEATGFEAVTIHSAIGIMGDDDKESPQDDGEIEMLDYGSQFVVDESSMMDQFIASNLLRRIPSGASVVFVGDPNQLPSVGCGNVLNEMIRSRVLPTTKLSVIFRQKGTNPIVENAARILEGRQDLVLYPQTNSFAFMDLSDSYAILRRACHMYVDSVRKFGLDNVVLLCPYRKSGLVNVNIFNRQLQHLLNPPVKDALTIRGKNIFLENRKSVSMEFRKGDKVMMTVNKEFAKNGDTGYIRDIRKAPDPDDPDRVTPTAFVEFNEDGILHALTKEDVYDLDLAYCMSVHKSQGSEYKTVIMVLCEEHTQMLKRNLFYTAITRAKENVLLIGQRSAMATAIADTNTKKRYTLLGDRLHYKLYTLPMRRQQAEARNH